ncbi:MAG: nitroreductase family protein [Planctomycetota bacterium]
MELMDVIRKRRSVRSYRPDPVPEQTLEVLFEALQAAPSGSNRQDYAFIFVQDAEKRRRIADRAGHQDFLSEAPLLMVAVCEPGRAFNVAIAVDHMILAATDEGLGTCWVGWFEEDPVRRILGVPDDKEVPIMVPIGYAAEQPEPRERKPLDRLIMRDAYAG